MRPSGYVGGLKGGVRRLATLVAFTGLVTLWCALGCAAAWGAGWWHVGVGFRPGVLPSGGSGEVVVSVENTGDSSIDGATEPVRLSAAMPAGLTPEHVGGGLVLGNKYTALECDPATVSCAFHGVLLPYESLELRVWVAVSNVSQGETVHGAVSGGGVAGAVISRPVHSGSGGVGFGVEEFGFGLEEVGGGPADQAGSHPFQVTGVVGMMQGVDTGPASEKIPFSITEKPAVEPVGLLRDVITKLPAGFLGNPTAIPECSLGAFETNVKGQEDECPAGAAVGVASATVMVSNTLGYSTFTQPIFNLEPASGEPARFGFFVAPADLPVILGTQLRDGPGEDYGINVTAHEVSQTAGLLNARVTFWGVPGDPRHDNARGWSCLAPSNGAVGSGPCNELAERNPTAFLSMPVTCESELEASLTVDSWANPAERLAAFPSEPLQGVEGCNRVRFSPTIEATPTTNLTDAPSGLNVGLNVNDEGLTAAEGTAQSQLQDATVALPAGLTVNPSSAVGLKTCTNSEYAAESLSVEGCPSESKVGTVSVETPLLAKVLQGAVYVAQPYENQFHSLIALYVVVKDPQTGVLVKLAGKVTPNLLTGQLTSTFEGAPRLPFSHFKLAFREGAQAPLVTPEECGVSRTVARLTPWSNPASSIEDTSTFQITNEGNCASPGSAPVMQAGTTSNAAGSFSPFVLRLARTDAETELADLTTVLPEGLTAKLSGIPYCSQAAAALAEAKSGEEELGSPSCPAASLLGHTLASAGTGSILADVPGFIYLSGPDGGDPFSLIAITPAVVGPFDLGTVVLRFGLQVNPLTAQVTVQPLQQLPHIVDGIVTHLRALRVSIDRPGFMLNPTNCTPTQITTDTVSLTNQSATQVAHYQAASCASLAFAPKLSMSTSAHTSRLNGASLTTKLAFPRAPLGTQTNIAKIKVTLPKALPARQSTLRGACRGPVFEADPADCPATAIVGRAKAITPLLSVPLQGPAYFVSHGNEAFPSLTLVLQGDNITIDLVGSTHINGKNGITSTTFKAVPDQPVTSFELVLPAGPHSALGTIYNLCKTPLTAPTEYAAQNGMQKTVSTKITVAGCRRHKAKHKAKRNSK